MIYLILLFGSLVISSQANVFKQIKPCEICIVNSICTDDTIYFNISISQYCLNPINTYFTYFTDINSRPHYYNTTTTCNDCYINVTINAIHNAWDYTLTLLSPEPSQSCSVQHVAHCGGSILPIIWYITAGLSGLAIVMGFLLSCIRYARRQRKSVKSKRKKAEIAIINA